MNPSNSNDPKMIELQVMTAEQIHEAVTLGLLELMLPKEKDAP